MKNLPTDQKLLQLASMVVQMRQQLTDIVRGNEPGSQCIKDEMEAYEELETASEAFSHAARVIAMRLNRAALGAFEPIDISTPDPWVEARRTSQDP